MKKYKFRMWDKKNKIMHKFYLHNLLEKAWQENRDDNGLWDIKNYEKYVMQYIGQRDINGKDIYEGDIVVWMQFETQKGCVMYKGTVIFEEAQFLIKIINKDEKKKILICEPTVLNIIGNIYENPLREKHNER